MTDQTTELQRQLQQARSEIKNLRSQLISLKSTFQKDCQNIERQLVNGIDAPQNARAEAEPCNCELAGWRSVGVVNTWFPGKRGVPRQAALSPEAQGVITLSPVVINNPAYALSGLSEFSHIWIIFHFHQTCSSHVKTKVAPPRLGGARVGLFGTRSPHRPCPIGLSLVKLDRVEENKVYFSGVDMVDGTPVLDIKPYIPQYDDPRCLLNRTDLSPVVADEVPGHELLESETEVNTSANSGDRLVEGEAGSESPLPTLSRLSLRDDLSDSVGFASSPVITPTDDTVAAGAIAQGAASLGQNQGSRNQREAPDGEEGPEGPVQVASWITSPPARLLQVSFDERAIAQLATLPEHAALQATVTRLLEQDPRSNYLRRKLGSQFYTFRIDSFYVSVKFDDAAGVVTVNTIAQAV